jgi:hypothetical protein
MSIFTGLQPPQHNVFPSGSALAETIPTLPERFAAAGFRAHAFTEGGFVAQGYGFERGFEVYDDTAYTSDTDIERTFRRGLHFLESLESDERFFLFLHSYSIHDPYDPPPIVLKDFDEGEEGPNSRGDRLRAFNQGEEQISDVEIQSFRRRYHASVRYVDSVLESFLTELASLALLGETTVVITSDHGEEFLEHGRLGHTQLYPESLAVPLLLLHPDQTTGARITDEVGLIDLAPTLLELAELPPFELVAGRSLVPYLIDPSHRRSGFTYAEIEEASYQRSLIGDVDGTRFLLVATEVKRDGEGTWVEDRNATLDYFGSRLEFRGRSFHSPRRVGVAADGRPIGELEVAPEWGDLAIDLPGEGVHRLTLEADDCVRPVDVGEGDVRCLSLIVQGPPLATVELYDLDADPLAQDELSRRRPEVTGRMMNELDRRRWDPAGEGVVRMLSEEEQNRLRALGYLD